MNFKRENELVERVKTKYNEDKDVLELIKCYENATYAEYGDRYDFEAEAVSRWVNDFGFPDDKIADKMAHDHPTLQQSFMRMCLKFIKKMSEKTYCDGRNEASVNASKKMIDAIKNETYLPFV